MDLLIVAVAGIVIALVIGAAVRAFKSPASGSPDEPTAPDRTSTTGSEEADDPNIPSDPGEGRPGGPGAESMNASSAGQPTPGGTERADETPDAVPPSEAGRRNISDD